MNYTQVSHTVVGITLCIKEIEVAMFHVYDSIFNIWFN